MNWYVAWLARWARLSLPVYARLSSPFGCYPRLGGRVPSSVRAGTVLGACRAGGTTVRVGSHPSPYGAGSCSRATRLWVGHIAHSQLLAVDCPSRAPQPPRSHRCGASVTAVPVLKACRRSLSLGGASARLLPLVPGMLHSSLCNGAATRGADCSYAALYRNGGPVPGPTGQCRRVRMLAGTPVPVCRTIYLGASSEVSGFHRLSGVRRGTGRSRPRKRAQITAVVFAWAPSEAGPLARLRNHTCRPEPGRTGGLRDYAWVAVECLRDAHPSLAAPERAVQRVSGAWLSSLPRPWGGGLATLTGAVLPGFVPAGALRVARRATLPAPFVCPPPALCATAQRWPLRVVNEGEPGAGC